VTVIYTSPFAPKWMTASVHDGGLSEKESLPSPIPEPVTLALLTFGTVGVLILRRRR